MDGRSEKELKLEEKWLDIVRDDLPPIFLRFFRFLQSEKTMRTTDSYMLCIVKFAKFVGNGTIKHDFYREVETKNIDQYMAEIGTRTVHGNVVKTSDSYRATTWSALNTFFSFLNEEGYISSNPVEWTARPQISDTPTMTFLSLDEIHSIIDNVKKLANKKSLNRDLAILKLGFTTGLSISSILQINVQDVDLERRTIKLRDNKKSIQLVPFGENLAEQLDLWIEDRKIYFSDANSDALFISSYRKRITRDGVAKMLTKYSEGATDKNVTPQVMRNSAMSNLFEKTGDIIMCQAMLNHKSVATTQRYFDQLQAEKEDRKLALKILDDLI